MVDLKLNPLELEQARLNEIAEGLTSPVAVVLEGRDTAGKSGTIRALTNICRQNIFLLFYRLSLASRLWRIGLVTGLRKCPRESKSFFMIALVFCALVQQINGWCSDFNTAILCGTLNHGRKPDC